MINKVKVYNIDNVRGAYQSDMLISHVGFTCKSVKCLRNFFLLFKHVINKLPFSLFKTNPFKNKRTLALCHIAIIQTQQ